MKRILMVILGILIVSCKVVNTAPDVGDEPVLPETITPPYTIELHSDKPVELILSYEGKVRKYEVYGDFSLEVHEVVKDVKVDWRFGGRSGVSTIEGTDMEFEKAFMGKTGKILDFENGKMSVIDPFDPFWKVEIGTDFVPEKVVFYPISPSSEVALLLSGNTFKMVLLSESVELLEGGQLPRWLESYALNPYISKFLVLESGSTKPDSMSVNVESGIFDEFHPVLGDEKSERSRIFTSEGNVYTFINTSAGLSVHKYRDGNLVKHVDLYSMKLLSSPLPVDGYLVIPLERSDGVTIGCLDRKSFKYEIFDQVLSEPEDFRLVAYGSEVFALLLYDVVFKSFLIDPISCTYTDSYEYYSPPSEIHEVLTDGERAYLLTSFGRKVEILKPDLSKMLELEFDDDVHSISVYKGAVLLNGEKLTHIPDLERFRVSPMRFDLEPEYVPSLTNVEAYHDYSAETLKFRLDYEDPNEDDVFVKLHMTVRENWIASDYSTVVLNATELIIDVGDYNYVDEATVCVEDTLGFGSCQNLKNIW